jgi:addiction module RelE/StbE family toxin
VAEVIYSAQALLDIERAFHFLRQENPLAAIESVAAISSAIDNLRAHPLIGRRVEAELRELVISYGRTGYVALYRFVIGHDEVRILALRHQRELGYLP